MGKKTEIRKRGDYQVLTKNEEQARTVLTLSFKENTEEGIIDGIFEWIRQHPESEDIKRFLNLFSDLEKVYTFSEFLDPKCEISGWEKRSIVRETTALSITMVLVNCSWKLFGRKIHEGEVSPWELDTSSDEYKVIAGVVSEVEIGVLIGALFSALLSTVGDKYYKHYLGMLNKKDVSKKTMIALMETERLVNPHAQLIVLAGCIRAFLDACFFLFKEAINIEMNQQDSKGFTKN